ncbi:MAG: PEP-CTERM sorting domain-containing protein [Planctomycetales bacterium]|nr:PEP-CTERM sorting domain-containing protein [Planctomycetales bacterium]
MYKIRTSLLLAACGVATMHAGALQGQTLITDFNTFFENELYASWASLDAVIDSGPDSYSVTATGYGSNYTYIGALGILGAGNTHVELDVTLSGPPEADGLLGPIVTLVDADGSNYNFAWYGQLLGHHVLTQSVSAPTWISAPGTTPGLDLDNLLHMHLQLDPGGFGTMGAYTVAFNNLNLIEVPTAPGDFDEDGDVDGADFLIWQRGGSPLPGSVDDLQAWQANFGTTAPLIAAAPEPGAIGLILLAGLFALRLRRFTGA